METQDQTTEKKRRGRPKTSIKDSSVNVNETEVSDDDLVVSDIPIDSKLLHPRRKHATKSIVEEQRPDTDVPPEDIQPEGVGNEPPLSIVDIPAPLDNNFRHPIPFPETLTPENMECGLTL